MGRKRVKQAGLVGVIGLLGKGNGGGGALEKV